MVEDSLTEGYQVRSALTTLQSISFFLHRFLMKMSSLTDAVLQNLSSIAVPKQILRYSFSSKILGLHYVLKAYEKNVCIEYIYAKYTLT